MDEILRKMNAGVRAAEQDELYHARPEPLQIVEDNVPSVERVKQATLFAGVVSFYLRRCEIAVRLSASCCQVHHFQARRADQPHEH